jgi:UDP-glucose 4-epimerase
MRYQIAGSAGFIGSHLVAALTPRGDDVLVLEDLSTGTVEHLDERQARPRMHAHTERGALPRVASAGSVDLVDGSITNKALVDDCMFGSSPPPDGR